MTDISTQWLTVPDVAERLDVPVTRVRQFLRDGLLLATRIDGVLQIPADFIGEGAIVKGLPGTITLLRDAGHDDEEALHWLFRPDDSLPGTPIQALVENRGTEVKRRAQASAF
ncbi:MAG: Rv2175c family DNA-binding protein [Mycobacteriales bacterium]